MSEQHDPLEWKLKALEHAGGAPAADAGECPSDERFAAFMDGLLPEKEAASLKEHVLRCPDCHAAFLAFGELAPGAGPPVPAKLLAAARALARPAAARLCLRLLDRFFEILNAAEVRLLPGAAPATALRGAAADAGRRFEVVDVAPVADCLKAVRIQHLEEAGKLKVTAIPADGLPPERLARLRVELHWEGERIQSWPLRAGGTSLNPLEGGRYCLKIQEVRVEGGRTELCLLGLLELELDTP